MSFLNIFVLVFCTITLQNAVAKHEQETTLSLQSASGLIKLIVKAYVDELLRVNDLEDSHMRSKLLGLSDHIVTHPALHQRYLFVGKKPPIDYDPDHMPNRHESQSNAVSKRAEPSQFPSEEICKTDRQWEQINTTHDFYDNEVEVFQDEDLQQFVFSYRCAVPKGPCIGISPFYHSECTERNGWMYMYYKQKSNGTPQWGYVSAPHHCACKIQPKYVPTPANEVD